MVILARPSTGSCPLPSEAPRVVIGGEASVHSLITRLPFELSTTRFTSFSDSRKVTLVLIATGSSAKCCSRKVTAWQDPSCGPAELLGIVAHDADFLLQMGLGSCSALISISFTSSSLFLISIQQGLVLAQILNLHQVLPILS